MSEQWIEKGGVWRGWSQDLGHYVHNFNRDFVVLLLSIGYKLLCFLLFTSLEQISL